MQVPSFIRMRSAIGQFTVRIFFPVFHFLTFHHSTVRLSALVLFIFLLSACSPSDSIQSDSWRLSPPELIGTTTSGSLSRQSAKSLTAAQTQIQFNLNSFLKFAPQDRGLKLSYEIRCGDFFSQGSTMTSALVSLARLVPPQILAIGRTSSVCEMKFEVKNQIGSSHRFLFHSLLFQPVNPELKESSPTHQSQFRKHEALRLICGTWWSEEDPENVNSDLSLGARITSLANATTVMGKDDRSTRFRPNCRVLQLIGESALQWLSDQTLTLSGVESELTRTIAIKPDSHYRFLNQPLMNWALKNASNRKQIVFVSKRFQNLKMSYGSFAAHGLFGWSKFILVPYDFLVQSSYPIKDTEDGTFIEIPSGRQISLQLKLNLNAHCMVSLRRPDTRYLRFEMKEPVTYAVIDREVTLDEITNEKEALTNLDHRGLFSSLVVEFGMNSNEIIDGGTFADAERRLGTGLQLPQTNVVECYAGQLFEVPQNARRPITD